MPKPPPPELTIRGVDHTVAQAAVLRWHYSRLMPKFKLIKYGIWEDDLFTGVVIFGQGNTPNAHQQFGITRENVCELVRIALRSDHRLPVTQLVSKCLALLKASNPGIRLVVSYADSAQGHHGGIYQAGNWIYIGASTYEGAWRINGKVVHHRTVSENYPGRNMLERVRAEVDPNATRITTPAKYKYLMPLDRQMRRRVAKLTQPYPRARSQR